MRSGWDPATPLGIAHRWLLDRIRDGERCPLCDQRAQLYRRAINGAMATVLVRAYARHDRDWFHMPTLTRVGGDSAKLRYWELLEEEPLVRPDGGRAGWWRLTDAGVAFVRGEATVPHWALIYDGRCLGFEGDAVAIRDCLPKHFDLDALLQGAA